MARDELVAGYLDQLRGALGGEPIDRDRLLEELEDHLQEAIACQEARGVDEAHAVSQALRACGTPAELVAAVRDHDEKGHRIMALSRWTGFVGVAAVPVGAASTAAWNWYGSMLTMLLVAVAVVGILAVHWRSSRTFVSIAFLVFAGGSIAAASATVGQDSLLRAVGIPAFAMLLAVSLLCYAFLRARLLPGLAVTLLLVGIAILIGLNMLGYVSGNEPPFLAGLGGVLALAGWVWMNAALIRPWSTRAPAAV